MKLLISIFLLLPSLLFSQSLPEESTKWLNENLTAENVSRSELLTKFSKDNFSHLFLSEQVKNLGFIGNNYRRFYIHFLEIVKDKKVPSRYLVKGKTRVGNNICDFEGEIKILHIKEINKIANEVMLNNGIQVNDSDIIKRADHKEFMILAEYTFKENPKQKWTGIFKGILRSDFYMSRGKIIYDNLNLASDGFSNNQFVGTWTSYKGGIPKICNWGDYRIPYSGDLDVGAGEFSPNEKYLKYGWESYHNAGMIGTREAWKAEEKKWW